TSSTAAALMVGVGVVTLFTVFAASLKASIHDSVSKSFGGDLVISAPSFGGGGLSPQLSTAAAAVPAVQQATGLGRGEVTIAGSGHQITIADPVQLAQVLKLDVIRGSIETLAPQQFAVSKQKADSKGWHLGTRVRVTFVDGSTTNLEVGAIYQARDVAGDYLLSRSAYAAHSIQDIDSVVLIKVKTGASVSSTKSALETVAQQYGRPDVLDRQQYVTSQTKSVNTILGLIYVMLALAIIIALMGIANTLSLSIYERTRELGLLRAVGETRGQLRSMVRWESVIIALFGTVGGLGLGVFLGWALVRAASTSQGLGSFAAPPTQLIVVLVAGAIAGMVAGFRPARRAAKLDLVRALAAD
ncbi:MAG TPA: ABC transporter permease, partial [Acidimicrobiales bacterium]|nr:ABC transporter permease [Acidimicrobiales bacterium]